MKELIAALIAIAFAALTIVLVVGLVTWLIPGSHNQAYRVAIMIPCGLVIGYVAGALATRKAAQ